MMPWCWRAMSVVGFCCVALCVNAAGVDAMSDARLHVAREMAQRVQSSTLDGQQDADLSAVLNSYRDAGVDVVGVRSRVEMAAEATPLSDISASLPYGPAPGDFAEWVPINRDGPAAAGDSVYRIGIFVTNAEMVVYDESLHHFVRVHRATVSNDSPNGEELPYAQPGSFRAYRLDPRRWPGGRDDVTIPTGKVALTDPGHTAADMVWAGEHPRDGDLRWQHVVGQFFGTGLALLSETVGGAIDLALALGRKALEHAGPLAGVALLLFGLLGKTFDGRGLHTALTAVLLAGVAIFVPFGALIVGAAVAGNVLGGVGTVYANAVFGAASFATSMLTGVDDSDHSTVGGVVLAVITAPLTWCKSLLATRGAERVLAWLAPIVKARPAWLEHIVGRGAARAALADARIAEAVRTPINLASDAADLSMVNPRTWGHLFGWVQRLSGHRTVPMVPEWFRGGMDFTSLLWRREAIPSEVLGQVGHVLHAAESGVRDGSHSWPMSDIQRYLDSLDPSRRDAIMSAVHRGAAALKPPLTALTDMGHVHSGAHVISAVAASEPMPTVPMPSQLVRREEIFPLKME